MKSVFRFLIGSLLAFKASSYLKKNKVEVIAITGSVAKTSTKEAVYQILKKRFDVYSSKKSFNTPIGLSLAVLQEDESGFSSIRAWCRILHRALFQKKPVHEKVVLEMGADAPGDIKRLLKIAKPHIAVITHIAPVHLATGQFRGLSDIAKEKSTLIKKLSAGDVAVLNQDDSFIAEMKTNAKRFTYAVESEAVLRAKELRATTKNIRFTLEYKGQSEDFSIPVLGKFQIYVFLPAIAIGLEKGLSLKECAETLESFKLPPGRMNPLEGVNSSTIIDGSYNASPASMKKGIELLDELSAERKIAALGTMNELGEKTKEAHLEIGAQAAKVADMLIAVGVEASTIKQGAMDAGMSEEKIRTFLDSEEAGHFLKDQLTSKDLILVKGSQNRVRMERLIKVILSDPERASQLLCRQGENWEKI